MQATSQQRPSPTSSSVRALEGTKLVCPIKRQGWGGGQVLGLQEWEGQHEPQGPLSSGGWCVGPLQG